MIEKLYVPNMFKYFNQMIIVVNERVLYTMSLRYTKIITSATKMRNYIYNHEQSKSVEVEHYLVQQIKNIAGEFFLRSCRVF